MIPTLVIFDIDGTLIKESKASIVSYINAISACYDVEINQDDLLTSGKTDIQIFKEILRRFEIEANENDYCRLINKYLSYLKIALKKYPGIILPGVRHLLNILSRIDYIQIALGTGNIEQGARIKLAIHNLNSYFLTGGFGTDAIRRSDIISCAIKKSQEKYMIKYQRIVVVGDTPYDIESAKINNVYSIAVATGPFSIKKLESKKPTFVLRDLMNEELFFSVLNTLPPLKYSVDQY